MALPEEACFANWAGRRWGGVEVPEIGRRASARARWERRGAVASVLRSPGLTHPPSPLLPPSHPPTFAPSPLYGQPAPYPRLQLMQGPQCHLQAEGECQREPAASSGRRRRATSGAIRGAGTRYLLVSITDGAASSRATATPPVAPLQSGEASAASGGPAKTSWTDLEALALAMKA